MRPCGCSRLQTWRQPTWQRASLPWRTRTTAPAITILANPCTLASSRCTARSMVNATRWSPTISAVLPRSSAIWGTTLKPSGWTALAESLTYENKYDEAVSSLDQALAIQERIYGAVHPSVAETLNELGNVASMRDHLDEAEARFQRAAGIYRAVYGDHHYLVAIALSNVAGIIYDKKDYPRAEQLFRDVIRRYKETLPADNVNLAIAHIKLGRTLLRENRYKDAEPETLAGYEVLTRQSSPSTSFIRAARKDLAAEYEALNQPQQAARFRAELAAGAANPPIASR